MARSTRLPTYYICCGAAPAEGKRSTSRALRRDVRQVLQHLGAAFDFAHPQDRRRGRAGSRSPDYGWDYFGDGRMGPFHRRAGAALLDKLHRK